MRTCRVMLQPGKDYCFALHEGVGLHGSKHDGAVLISCAICVVGMGHWVQGVTDVSSEVHEGPDRLAGVVHCTGTSSWHMNAFVRKIARLHVPLCLCVYECKITSCQLTRRWPVSPRETKKLAGTASLQLRSMRGTRCPG